MSLFFNNYVALLLIHSIWEQVTNNWYVYRSYFRFRPLPVYFPYQTSISEVSEIQILFLFPKLPFSISVPIKNIWKGNGFSVYGSFPTVFIPSLTYWGLSVAHRQNPTLGHLEDIYPHSGYCGLTSPIALFPSAVVGASSSSISSISTCSL
jgi:hypothetical protein